MSDILDFEFIDWLWSQGNTKYERLAELIKMRAAISAKDNDEIQKAWKKIYQW